MGSFPETVIDPYYLRDGKYLSFTAGHRVSLSPSPSPLVIFKNRKETIPIAAL